MNKLIMICGLPASGKSTFAIKLSLIHNANIISSDDLRVELFGDVNNQNKNQELFLEISKRVKSQLLIGNVILDSTNISHKRRKAFLGELKKIPCEKICIFVATPYQQCLEQNRQRSRVVPEHVIKNMYLNFDVPAYFEGWDDIQIVWSIDDEYDAIPLFEKLETLEHNNPHHTFTVGKHCRTCGEFIIDLMIKDKTIAWDANLILAGFYHDIGKEFTKAFKNGKGEATEIAHYFNHMNVSAYDVLFYLKDRPVSTILDVCQLIRWHMQPFFMETEKAKTKFINLVGQEFYDRLMILHQADRKAH